jgi:chemotaxis protein CheD
MAVRDIQLHPGDLFLTRDAARMQTILGSCIAFTMRHEDSRLSGMCHCLLATKPAGKSNNGCNPYAYVDLAFEEMLAYFKRGGVRPTQLEVKLFGGADVLHVLSGPKSVGRENIHTASRLIAEHGVRLLASDVGGMTGRKIMFDTVTGKVQVKRMRSEIDRESPLAVTAQFVAV